MTRNSQNHIQAGFTLVELSIVLIVIGLLIAGVLKGKELIENSKITSTVMQVETYSQATVTFRKSYSRYPGDIEDPSTRLANCTTSPCSDGGNNDSMIGGGYITSLTSAYVIEGETRSYWPHLVAADLITDVNIAPTLPYKWGDSFPAAAIGGGFHLQYIWINSSGGFAPARGQYLVLRKAADYHAVADPMMNAKQAFALDQKMDDGLPQTGDVRGVGSSNCTGTTYGLTGNGQECNLLIKLKL
jgi:prepilin-type N-terminal cleavage/methylation domain-containing protein